MYLLKLPSGVYYTRIPTPIYLRKRDFPSELRYSLFTKNRSIAIERNLRITACVKKHLVQIKSQKSMATYKEFQVSLLHDIAAVRRKYSKADQLDHYLSQSHDSADIEGLEGINLCAVQIEREGKQEISVTPYRHWLSDFLDEKRGENISHLSCHQLEQRIGHFLEFLEALNTEQITTQEVKRYVSKLHSEGRAVKTNKSYFAAVKQFLKWLKTMKYLPENPSEEVNPSFKAKKHASEFRERWTFNEITRLFHSDEYKSMPEDFKWISELQLYQGGRPNEACQLYTVDIKKKAGIDYLYINDASPLQHLKNEHALRAIPIHPKLVEDGFLDFVQSRASRESHPLFIYSPIGPDRDWSKTYRTQFGKLQTKIGMKPKVRPTPYGLRHTFIDVLKQKNLKEHQVAEVVGHTNPHMTYGRYGKKLDLPKLLAVVEQFEIIGEEEC